MSDEITRHAAVMGLADLWEEEAERYERLDSRDRAARAMRLCAEQLREVVDCHAEVWVSHAQVRLYTGRSDSYLYPIYRRLADEGRARKEPRGWRIQRSAAQEIPVRDDHDPAEAIDDVEDLAALYLDRAERRAS